MSVSVCEFLYYADRTRMKSWKFVYLSSMVCLNPPGGRYHSSTGWQVRDTHPVVWPLVGLLSLKILHASESYSILIAQGTRLATAVHLGPSGSIPRAIILVNLTSRAFLGYSLTRIINNVLLKCTRVAS